jgi:hypothetical protein
MHFSKTIWLAECIGDLSLFESLDFAALSNIAVLTK